jgi:ubiquinone/menaquinone biosynthesis C-methylase UbiE
MVGAALLALGSTSIPALHFINRSLWVMGWVCFTEFALMVFSSYVGKFRERDKLLDGLGLRGDETVLDLGCGRGLLLIGAAKRLPSGKAVGVDLWQTQDQSGNAAEATRANAEVKGVADRVELHTADMRALPFTDDTFDVIVSSLAIHNIPDRAGREQALREAVRVLKAGGRCALLDFRNTGDYAAALRTAGAERVAVSGPSLWMFPPVRVVTAQKAGA